MYNRITLVGNLGADPETRQTPSGTSITSFRLATNHVYSQIVDGEREQVQQTEWYRVNCFGSTAESVQQYLPKGVRYSLRAATRLAHGSATTAAHAQATRSTPMS